MTTLHEIPDDIFDSFNTSSTINRYGIIDRVLHHPISQYVRLNKLTKPSSNDDS